MCGKGMEPFNYMLIHLATCIIQWAPSWIWWNYYEAHTALIVIAFCVAVWNGGFYFMIVVPKKAEKSEEEEMQIYILKK